MKDKICQPLLYDTSNNHPLVVYVNALEPKRPYLDEDLPVPDAL